MSSKRKCRLSPDSVCYICGYYIGTTQLKHKISPGTKLVSANSSYSGMPVGDQDKTWDPHACSTVQKLSVNLGRMVTRKNKVYAICNS